MPTSESSPAGSALPGASRHPEVSATLDAAEAVLRAEALVCRAIFAGPGLVVSERAASILREPSGGDAIRAAVKLAERGERASVLLSPRELLGAIDALAAAAAARAAILVHVVGAPTRPSPGRGEIAPALDAGAGVLVSWSAQDAVDMSLAARRAAEDSETPFLHVYDAEGAGESRVLLPSRELVTQFLGGERRGALRAEGKLKGGPAAGPELDLQRKREERSFASRVPFALASAMRQLGDLTGRPLPPVERGEMHEAEEVLVAVGSAYVAARSGARVLRDEGHRVGVVGLRVLRPFFAVEVVKATSRARAIVVMEPLDTALAPSGPVASAVKAAFADALTWAPGFPGVGRIPPVVSAVFATIGADVGEAEVRAAVGEIAAGERARRLVVFGSDS